MAREKKAQIIDGLREVFSECNISILTDYRGLTAAVINDLRRKLRESGVEYRVVKNTLARFAVERAGRSELADLFEGPVAVASGYGEITEPARVLTEFIRNSRLGLGIKGGFLSDRLLTPEDVATLSALPSREILISQVMAGIQSPIVSLVGVLGNPIRGILGVLQARMKQLEGE